MYICLNCSRVFEEPKIDNEKIGECFGRDVYEETGSCPYCGCDYTEAEQCEICGEFYYPSDLVEGICTYCADCMKSDFDTCYLVAKEQEYEECICINGAIASVLTEEEIDKALREYIKSKDNVDMSAFIDEDYYCFCEALSNLSKKGII